MTACLGQSWEPGRHCFLWRDVRKAGGLSGKGTQAPISRLLRNGTALLFPWERLPHVQFRPLPSSRKQRSLAVGGTMFLSRLCSVPDERLGSCGELSLCKVVKGHLSGEIGEHRMRSSRKEYWG